MGNDRRGLPPCTFVTGRGELAELLQEATADITALTRAESVVVLDPAAAEAIGDRLETGTVFMNRCDYLDPALCWTGCKDTGRGAGLSILAYQALTRPKSYHLKKA